MNFALITITNECHNRRPRTNMKEDDIAFLKEVFVQVPKPLRKMVNELSKGLKMSPRQVSLWVCHIRY